MQNEPNIHDKPLDEMSDVFGLFDSNIELAGILNVGQSTVSEMKRRKNIPPQYWPRIVEAAAGNRFIVTNSSNVGYSSSA